MSSYTACAVTARHKPPAEAVRICEEQILAAFKELKGARSVNQLTADTGVDRRKLTQLSGKKAAGRPPQPPALPRSFTLAELMALDSFTNGALTEALRKARSTSIIHSLEGAKEVTFILGARELEKTDHVSRWDVRAMTALVRAMQRQCASAPEINVEDVLRVRPNRSGSAFDLAVYREKTKTQPWTGLLDRHDGALIALGSSRSLHVVEHMLANVFDEEIYRKPSTEMPFSFVWTKELYERLPSTFARVGEPPAVRPGRVPSDILGLDVEGRFYEISPREPSWNAYGVCVAQRRRNRATWIVVAGATGPATFCTAEMLGQVDVLLPEPESDDVDGAPVWFVVEAKIKQDDDRVGDNRSVAGGAKIVHGPSIWDREKKRSAVSPPARKRAKGGKSK
jgi:hypothetical protein